MFLLSDVIVNLCTAGLNATTTVALTPTLAMILFPSGCHIHLYFPFLQAGDCPSIHGYWNCLYYVSNMTVGVLVLWQGKCANPLTIFFVFFWIKIQTSTTAKGWLDMLSNTKKWILFHSRLNKSDQTSRSPCRNVGVIISVKQLVLCVICQLSVK